MRRGMRWRERRKIDETFESRRHDFTLIPPRDFHHVHLVYLMQSLWIIAMKIAPSLGWESMRAALIIVCAARWKWLPLEIAAISELQLLFQSHNANPSTRKPTNIPFLWMKGKTKQHRRGSVYGKVARAKNRILNSYDLCKELWRKLQYFRLTTFSQEEKKTLFFRPPKMWEVV